MICRLIVRRLDTCALERTYSTDGLSVFLRTIPAVLGFLVSSYLGTVSTGLYSS